MTSNCMSTIYGNFQKINCYLLGGTRVSRINSMADYNSIVIGLTLWYGILLDYNSMICTAASESQTRGRILKHARDGWASGELLTEFLKTLDDLNDILLRTVAQAESFKGSLLRKEIASWEVPAWFAPLKGIIKLLCCSIDTTTTGGEAQLYRTVRQIASFLKKLEVDRPDLREATLDEFLTFEEFLESDVPRRKSSIEYLRNVFDMKTLLGKHDSHFSSGPIVPCHGPGVVADTSVKCWLDKYTHAKLDVRVGYLLAHAGLGNQQDYLPVVSDGNSARVSRHISVPKTWKKLRGISAEPPELLFWQEGVLKRLDAMFTEDSWWAQRINLHCQDKSRKLARLGSVDGSLATIDLSAASDSVTLQLVRDVFGNTEMSRWLIGTRSTHTLCGEKLVQIRKFAPMGSATNFPVECMVFTLAAEIAVCRTQRPGSKSQPVCVFGDDIIVPTYAVQELIGILQSLGFSVNTDKSFSTGFFREACGAEHWRGFDLVPCRYKRCGFRPGAHYIGPDESDAIVALANQLLERGLHDTRKFLLELLFKKYFKLGKERFAVQHTLIPTFSGEGNTLATSYPTGFNLDVEYRGDQYYQTLYYNTLIWRERPIAKKPWSTKLREINDVCKYTEWLIRHQDGLTDFDAIWEKGWVITTNGNQWSRLPLGVTLVPTNKWVSSPYLSQGIR